MSVWTEVEFQAVLPRHAHYSIEKSIYVHFEASEVNKPKIEQFVAEGTVMYKGTFSFCDDGLHAAKMVSTWTEELRGLVKNKSLGTYVDVTASIRWLG